MQPARQGRLWRWVLNDLWFVFERSHKIGPQLAWLRYLGAIASRVMSSERYGNNKQRLFLPQRLIGVKSIGNQKKASGPITPGQQLQLPSMLPGRFVKDHSNESLLYGRTSAVHFSLPRAE
jgi:hypothetical protein